MKKCIALISALTLVTTAASAQNVFFGEYDNSFGFYGGYSLGDVDPESRHSLVMLQYAQPLTLFRLDARQVLHGGWSVGSSDSWLFAGASIDAALIQFGDFYVGAGISAFIRNEQTPRLSSRFTFGERAFVGYNITKRINTELYVQHYSNGDLTDENLGYNFVGMGINLKF